MSAFVPLARFGSQRGTDECCVIKVVAGILGVEFALDSFYLFIFSPVAVSIAIRCLRQRGEAMQHGGTERTRVSRDIAAASFIILH